MQHLKAWAKRAAISVAMGTGFWVVLGAIYLLFSALGLTSPLFVGVAIAAIFIIALLLDASGVTARFLNHPTAVYAQSPAAAKGTSFLVSLFLDMTKWVGAKPEPQLSTHGSILWNPPRHMRVGPRERVEVRIGDTEVALETLSEGLRGRGSALTDELEISPRMRAAVTSDPGDFTVQALSSQEQLIRIGQVTRWDFDVTPLRRGRRRLRLLASMLVKVGASDEVVDLPAYESEIRVSVAPLRATGLFLAENWKWVAGTIIVPLLAWAGLQSGVAPEVAKWLRAETGYPEPPPASVPDRPGSSHISPLDSHAGPPVPSTRSK